MSENEAVHISASKKTELEEELTHRKENLRPDILEKLQYAKSLGDLSENAEYHSAREDQGKNETRIKQIECILKNGVITEKKNDGTVGLGSEVTIEKQGGTEITYTIVGSEEADMSRQLLSHTSPLGQALLTKTEGESISITTPKGEVSYTIKTIA